MWIDIPIYDSSIHYNKNDLVQYHDRVYVCDKDTVGLFNRNYWHHAVIDIFIEYTFSTGSSVRGVLIPNNYELFSVKEFSDDNDVADIVLKTIQDISDRFSIRNIYVGKFGTSYIRTKLEEIGYNVHLGLHNGETYIDRVVRLTTEKTGLKGEKLVWLYALLALVKGEDVTLEDVHDAWAMDMNFKEKNPPYCYGHDHHSLVPFDQLSKETQERDREYVDAIKDVARILKDTSEDVK